MLSAKPQCAGKAARGGHGPLGFAALGREWRGEEAGGNVGEGQQEGPRLRDRAPQGGTAAPATAGPGASSADPRLRRSPPLSLLSGARVSKSFDSRGMPLSALNYPRNLISLPSAPSCLGSTETKFLLSAKFSSNLTLSFPAGTSSVKTPGATASRRSKLGPLGSFPSAQLTQGCQQPRLSLQTFPTLPFPG